MEVRIEQCSDPDVAIHKLTRNRFEAVVVDCTNEQTAALILKSARSAPTNKRAIAVAIIDGERAVKSAFELGAHFVLYKPISMERAKSGFRAAHALMKRERRRNQRIPVEIPVVLVSSGERRQSVTADLGEGGMAVQAGRISAAPGSLSVQFALPGDGSEIECPAEVAWENGHRQTGLRFVNMSHERRNQLKRWLERYAPDEMLAEDPPLSCKLVHFTPVASYLETNTPFPLHARVSLSVAGENLRIGAIVRIMHPDAGMGVEFVEESGESKESFERFTQVLQQHEGNFPEILVEPEGLDGDVPAPKGGHKKDSLLELFMKKKHLAPAAFVEELTQLRMSAKADKSKAAVFSV